MAFNTLVQLAPSQNYTVLVAGNSDVQITRFFGRRLTTPPDFVAPPDGFDLVAPNATGKFPMPIHPAALDDPLRVSVTGTLRNSGGSSGLWEVYLRKTAGTRPVNLTFMIGKVGGVGFGITDEITGTPASATGIPGQHLPPVDFKTRDVPVLAPVPPGVGPFTGTLTSPLPGGPATISAIPLTP